MFDPTEWSSESFVDAEPIVVGERRIITMAIPAKVVVAITSVYAFNADNVFHNMNLELNLDVSTLAARFFARQINATESNMLIPHEPIGANVILDTRAQTPLILNGPILFIVNDLTALASAAATMRFKINWLQARFGLQTSQAILPVGVTIP